MRLNELKVGEEYVASSWTLNGHEQPGLMTRVRVLSITSPPPGPKLEVEILWVGASCAPLARKPVGGRARIQASLLSMRAEEFQILHKRVTEAAARMAEERKRMRERINALSTRLGLIEGQVHGHPHITSKGVLQAHMSLNLEGAELERVVRLLESYSVAEEESSSALEELLSE